MKVIHCPRRFSASAWGGTETCLLNLAQTQRQAGIDSRIFTSQALCATAEEAYAQVPVRRFAYQYPYLGLSPAQKLAFDQCGGNLLSLSLLIALLREPGLDILHAHTGKRMGGIVRTAARLRGIPYVITLHGGQYDVPAEITAARNSRAGGNLEWGKVPGALLGSRRVLDDAAAIFCVGRQEQAEVQARYPQKRVEYLPNGVDHAHFSFPRALDFRAQHGIPADRKVLLCVGRIDPQKNQLLLLEVMARLARTQPDTHLVLVGPVTDDQYAAQINQTVQRLNLGNRVTLLPGMLPGDEALVAAYQAADLFCLPSVHEPFGIVILEAWAANLPVIASSVGGIPGFTQDQQNIALMNGHDAGNWATRIAELLQNPASLERFSTNGTMQVRQHYDWHHINHRVTQVYDAVINARSNKSSMEIIGS